MYPECFLVMYRIICLFLLFTFYFFISLQYCMQRIVEGRAGIADGNNQDKSGW